MDRLGRRVLTMATNVGKGWFAVLPSTMNSKPAPLFVWHASESVPIGLYRVQAPNNLIVTRLVVAIPPEPLASFLAEGGYLPRGVPSSSAPCTPRSIHLTRAPSRRCAANCCWAFRNEVLRRRAMARYI